MRGYLNSIGNRYCTLQPASTFKMSFFRHSSNFKGRDAEGCVRKAQRINTILPL